MSKKNETDKALEARLKKLKGAAPTFEELEDRLNRLKDRKSKSPIVKHTSNFEVEGIVEKALLDVKADKTLAEIKNRKNHEAKKSRAILDAKLKKTQGSKPLSARPQADNKNRPLPLKPSTALNKSQITTSQEVKKEYNTPLTQHSRVAESLKNSQDFKNLPKKQQLSTFERFVIEPIKKFINKLFNKEEINSQKTENSVTKTHNRHNADKIDEKIQKIEELKEMSKKGQKILSSTQAKIKILLKDRETKKEALKEKQLERKKKIVNNHSHKR